MSDQDDHSATAEQAPTGAIEIRSAEVINVSFPERTIEVIVAPAYEQRATVMHEEAAPSTRSSAATPSAASRAPRQPHPGSTATTTSPAP